MHFHFSNQPAMLFLSSPLDALEGKRNAVFFFMLLGFRWEDVLEELLKIAVASIKAQQFIHCILLAV